MKDKVKPGLSDLVRKLEAVKAKDIMTKDIITTTEDTHLSDVADTMIKMRISGMPVMSRKGRVKGMITATDLFLVMDMIKSGDIIEGGDLAVSNPTVKFAMSTEILEINKNTTLNEIIAIMKYKTIHTLPVYDKDKVIGVIGRRDVFKSFYGAIKELHL